MLCFDEPLSTAELAVCLECWLDQMLAGRLSIVGFHNWFIPFLYDEIEVEETDDHLVDFGRLIEGRLAEHSHCEPWNTSAAHFLALIYVARTEWRSTIAVLPEHVAA